jgi:Mg2+ and Co2+ transporter CorA
VNYKLNEFVKILTVLGAFFIPLGLIGQTAVFIHGGIPLLNRLVFWGIICVMLLVVYAALWNAKKRKIL